MIDTIIEEHIVNNVSHKSNGPAIVWRNGTVCWCLYGLWHRYYGPAFSDLNVWVIHGQNIIKG